MFDWRGAPEANIPGLGKKVIFKKKNFKNLFLAKIRGKWRHAW